MSISRRAGEVVLRSELSGLGGRSQLSEVIRSLMHEGKLLRLGSGVYAKAHVDSHGHLKLAGKPEQIADEIFKKLGLKVKLTRVDTGGSQDLYVMSTASHRISRKLKIGDGRVEYVRTQRGTSEVPELPADLEQLPKVGVGAYVERLACANNVTYVRSKLDDWAEAVTRAAGDDVRLDQTEKLLVALKKKKLIDGRQAARLLTNHMRETRNVRSVQGLRNGRSERSL
jgi:hypothetical protein